VTVTAAGLASVTAIKRGVKTLLEGQDFRDVLTELAAEAGDGLDVQPLRRVSRAERKILPAEMPYAEILAVRSIRTSDSAWSPARTHLLAIRFAVAGDDEETITDHVERYVLAARRLFSTDPGDEMRLFPYLGGSAQPEDEDYDPIAKWAGAEATLVKMGTIELVVYSQT
jgi:hypothetical protein